MKKILSYENWKQTRKKNLKNSIFLAIFKLFSKYEKIVKRIKVVFSFIAIKYPVIKTLSSIFYYRIIKIITIIRNNSIYIGRIICGFGIYSLCRHFFPLIEAKFISWFPEQADYIFQSLAKSELQIATKKKLAEKMARDAAMSKLDHIISSLNYIIHKMGFIYRQIYINIFSHILLRRL